MWSHGINYVTQVIYFTWVNKNLFRINLNSCSLMLSSSLLLDHHILHLLSDNSKPKQANSQYPTALLTLDIEILLPDLCYMPLTFIGLGSVFNVRYIAISSFTLVVNTFISILLLLKLVPPLTSTNDSNSILVSNSSSTCLLNGSGIEWALIKRGTTFRPTCSVLAYIWTFIFRKAFLIT